MADEHQRPRKGPTMRLAGVREIARAAGVSTATVSRTFNQPDQVRPTVREAVTAAAVRLNYLPNPAAKALSLTRNNRIGAVIPTIDNAIFARFIEALGLDLRKSGYALSIAVHEFDADREVIEVRSQLESGIDGLVLTGIDHDPALFDLLDALSVPYVLTSNHDPDIAHPTVGYDNRGGAMAVAGHLIDLGHRAFGIIAGETRRNDRARLRLDGTLSAIRAAGIDVPETAIVEVGFSTREGRAGLRTILAGNKQVTAVICANDVIAVGAILEARDIGIEVPQDLSITGFDGMEVAREFSPSITTVDVRADLMGHHAGQYLLARLRNEPIADHIEIPIEVTPGNSTARPRSGETLVSRR